ncbi:hypothetical protein WNY51_11515 [Pseudocolwellia sp. AS88]|nr:hypothetical protein [Pseudocolwellia sp. AS88]MDO7084177.1 hypothetical protein [Pseudocolwellia sp. AS88]
MPDRLARMGICYDIFFLQDICQQPHGYRRTHLMLICFDMAISN